LWKDEELNKTPSETEQKPKADLPPFFVLFWQRKHEEESKLRKMHSAQFKMKVSA